MTKYVSRRKQISNKLDEVLSVAPEINRDQFNLKILRETGASKNMVNEVLEQYAKAGEIKVTQEEIIKVTRQNREELLEEDEEQ